MATPFIGEIRIFGFDYPPRGWAYCNGQVLPILQNQSLYSLLGTAFGGDGRTTFQLPDLRSRVPMCSDTYPQGATGGSESVTLTADTMPAHKHEVMAYNGDADSPDPESNLISKGKSSSADISIYTAPFNIMPINEDIVHDAGKSVGHSNMQPYLAVNFCIALIGLFPQRS